MLFLQILTTLVEKYTLYFRICNFFFVQIKHLEPSFTNSVFRFRHFVSYSGLIAVVLPRVICRHESSQGGFSLDWAHTACFKNHSIAFLQGSLRNALKYCSRFEIKKRHFARLLEPRINQANQLNLDAYVVVQFCPWFKFYFLLFLGMVMYDNEFQTKENKV